LLQIFGDKFSARIVRRRLAGAGGNVVMSTDMSPTLYERRRAILVPLL
jgi:hypothetical protein